MGIASDRMGRSGVYGVALLIVSELHWKFREQHESDWGVDAIIEIADGDRPTGQLIALQIKSGDARQTQLRRDGKWTMYGRKHHLLRWLEYQIPVVIVLYDSAHHAAYWQHVNGETAAWTPTGFKIDIPGTQRLDASSSERLRALTDQWVPHHGTPRSGALRAIAVCNAAGVPMSPTEQLWDAIVGSPASRTAAALAYRLPLTGDAPAAHQTTHGFGDVVSLSLSALRGYWKVEPDTIVFVCENPLVAEVAATTLGPRCNPLVVLNGLLSPPVEYLLLGLGACGARLRVHVDHDSSGRRIMNSLFARSVQFEQWRPNGMRCEGGYEEECLPGIIDDLASL